jgi:hypothetical protein
MQLASSMRSDTQIDSHAILVGHWLRKDERLTRPLCSSVLEHQPQLFELAYLVTHKPHLRRCVLASRHSHGFCTVAQLNDKGLHIRWRDCANLEPETSLHSVTNFRKLCTLSLDMPACSALVIKPSIASASSSGLRFPTSIPL